MKLAVLKEIEEGENRVAVIPDSIKRLSKNGFDVLIETGAGLASGHSDQDYTDKGATIVGSAKELINQADCVVKVRPPTMEEAESLKDGSFYISIIQSTLRHDIVKKLQEKKNTKE